MPIPDSSAKERLSTGVRGLDDILYGGLPRNHLYLLQGDPGTGKTTIALQFLLEGIKRGERGLYVTLSESKRELEGAAASHHWDIKDLTIYEMSPAESELGAEAQYTVFHPADVELGDTISGVLKQVDCVQPSRVVFDSLSELRMLARESLRYRRQILRLKQYFAGRDCTVLMLDDRTAETPDQQLQSIAHGVIMCEDLDCDFGNKRRRLEVRKLRGARFREGYHDYAIETGGVVVYPRLVAAEHGSEFKREPVLSGIPELDQLFGGGIDPGTSTLLMGPEGCGKSNIADRYAFAAAERGESAIIYSFDEVRATMIARARGLGMDFSPHLASGRVEIHQIDPAELSPGGFVQQVRDAVHERGCSLLVIDSLSGFLNAMPGETYLLLQLHELLSYLSQHGVATLLTMAQSGFIGVMKSVVDVSYLTDSVLLFHYYEYFGEVRQALSVIKKRSGPHERTIRDLIFSSTGIRVGAPLTEFEGVLTGTPTFVGTREDRVRRGDTHDR